MKDSELESAKKVLQKLFRHHGLQEFFHADDGSGLDELYKRVQNNEFKTTREFQREVEKIINSLEKDYPDDIIASSVTKYYKSYLKELMSKYFITSVNVWHERVLNLEKKLVYINHENPLETKFDDVIFSNEQKLSSQLI